MAIRDVAAPAPVVTVRPHQLQRVIYQDGQLFAVWTVTLPSGRRESRSVAVSDAVNTTVTARASFLAMIDAIETDTFSRTGATRG